MKRSLLTFLVALLPSPLLAQESLEWPREIHTDEAEILVYQPQLEGFAGVDLTARAAVSVTAADADEPVFGAVWFKARVETDREERTVRILELEVTDAKFPEADPARLDKLAKLLAADITGWDPVLSLDRLLTMMEVVDAGPESSQGLRNDPPRILVVKHPALLVIIDGEPILEAIEDSKVMRVVNTPYLMLFDPGTIAYYMTDGEEWLVSPEYSGPWKALDKVPPALKALVPEDAVDGPTEEIPAAGRRPRIIVATEPTELIAIEREPRWKPIASTGLLFLSNTESDVLLHIESQRVFTLISGRWFAASGIDEDDWAFVDPESLPADFAQIPAGSEMEHVKASVPGTDEALDAVHEAAIPQTAAVPVEGTTVDVTYDGDPEFAAIEGSEVTYATNTAYSVLLVDGRYYCCHEAVWFVADSPTGPWVVCLDVPQAVYTIPPSCPIYHVRYVHVYYSTPTVVYVGYTHGYVGCYVYGGVIVYGTGWRYRAWYRHRYYARPATWGFAVRYHPRTGSWGVRIGYRGHCGGVAIGFRGGWWGGRRGGYRSVSASRTVHTPMGTFHREVDVERTRRGVDVDRRASFTPNENLYGRPKDSGRGPGDRVSGGRSPGDRSPGDRSPGDRSPGERSPGDRAGQRPGGDSGRGPGAARTREGPASSRRSNDVYADRQGNVHRRTEEGWQSRQRDGKWSQPQERPSGADGGRRAADTRRSGDARPSGGSRRSSGSRLERDQRSRERGTQRTQSSRQRSSGSRPGARPPVRRGRR